MDSHTKLTSEKRVNRFDDPSECFQNELEAPPTPPPTPPQLKFFPPLYLQRRSTVHQILRNYSVKTQAIQSLLDVGCGTDMELLTSLLPCDDKLPLGVLTGLDLDKEIWTVGEKNLFAREDYTARWRDLTISLLFGIFTSSPNHQSSLV